MSQISRPNFLDEAQEEADRREEEELEERARLNSIIRYLDTISDQSIEE